MNRALNANLVKTARKSVFGLLCLWSWNSLAAPAEGVEQTRSSRTVHFAHQDARFLASGQRLSSVMYLPSSVRRGHPLPLLILLHGINESRTLYPWFGGTHDLRPTLDAIAAKFDRGFVVAAPTQTKNAWLASNMWMGFEVDGFVKDLRRALPEGMDLDLDSIVVAGHSGAGCNPDGGLATATSSDSPISLAGLAFIDTCFDLNVAAHLADRNPEMKVWVLWQNLSWHRDPQSFIEQMTISEGLPVRLTELRPETGNPHTRVVFTAVKGIVLDWLLGNPEEPRVVVKGTVQLPIDRDGALAVTSAGAT